jgi:hypothetical protein
VYKRWLWLLPGIALLVFAVFWITASGTGNSSAVISGSQSTGDPLTRIPGRDSAFADVPVVANPAIFRSNRFTQADSPGERIPFENPNPDLTGFTLAAQNDTLSLYVEPRTLAIKVQNRSTGYIFSSTLDVMEDHRLNDLWVRFVESAVTIDYWDDSTGNVRRENLTASDATSIDIRWQHNGFTARLRFGISGITLDISVTLEGRDVRIEIPQGSIGEPQDIFLTQIHLYPFFGATKEDGVPGYMFIPDGAGALIRYGHPGNRMTSPFRANIYGANLGAGHTVSHAVRPGYDVTLPVFGKVHGTGQNAFLAIIEDGDNYAEMVAHTAGLITEFNWLTTVFSRRYTYFQPTTREEGRGPTITRLQNEANDFDLILRYRFLEGTDADYVGMALAYQDFLRERGMLTPGGQLERYPMMRLEFFGGERVPGLLFDRYQAMTPITDIVRYIEALQSEGVNHILTVYRSFARGGSAAFPQRFPVHRALGNDTDVRYTLNALQSRGIPLFFHTDYARAYDVGFFGRNDLATGLNSRLFGSYSYGGFYHFLLPEIALASARRDVDYLSRIGITRLALDSTGYVFTVLRNDNQTGRRHAREALNDLIGILNPASLALYRPNPYAWAHTNHYFDIPMTSTGHLYMTDTVPFMQIVMRGYVSYFAPASNFSANWRLDLLNLVDYGAYPSFLLTGDDPFLLAESRSSYIFSSAFEDWRGTVIEYYRFIRGALEPVRGMGITARAMLCEGISKTTYANGVSIVVNFTGADFIHDGITVPAEDFAVFTANEGGANP